MVTFPFLKAVLKGDKHLLRMSEARICNPPHYPEISVKNLYDDCLKLENMSFFFPDKYP